MPQKVSAILLAAGSSKRMGRPKQLLPLNGKPLIRHCIDSIMSSGIEDIVIVLGKNREKIENSTKGLPVRIALNEKPESEMTDSVSAGINAISPASTGVLVCLSDHPMVLADTFKTINDIHNEHPDKIIIPVYEGKRGHPCLFPKKALQGISSGLNMREVIKQNPEKIMLIPVRDPGVTADIDTEEDYKKLLSEFHS